MSETTYTYSAARNPRWVSPSQEQVILEVNFDHEAEDWVWFVTQESGDYPHTHELHARAIAGDFGPISDYQAMPDLVGDEMLDHIRGLRNELLAETDHWAYQDTPDMTDEQIAYRQALRDLPANVEGGSISFASDGTGYSIFNNIVMPTKP